MIKGQQIKDPDAGAHSIGAQRIPKKELEFAKLARLATRHYHYEINHVSVVERRTHPHLSAASAPGA